MDIIRHFNNGWRLGVIVSRGPKNITLFEPADLNVVKVKPDDERYFQTVAVRPAHVARIIERRAKLYRRIKRRHSAKLAKRIAAELRV